MKYRNRTYIFLVLLMLIVHNMSSQSVSFDLKTSPNIHFNFNTVQKYISGITIMNACRLNVDVVGTQWDLYVGATTSVPGQWDVSALYSVNGILPPVDILQLQLRNASNTSQVPGFFPIQDISTPTYVIGSAAATDPAITCPNAGANQEGNYLASPGCYRFDVDLRVIPGLNLRSGSYSLRIDYILVQDL